MPAIDVLINAYGKPFQTALTLLSLLRHSGRWIDTIWLNLDRPDHSRNLGRQFVVDLLEKVVVHEPRHWNWINHIDETRYGDEAYRHSIRYQYGWEKSDKDHVLVVHNDIHVLEDVAGLLLSRIGDRLAAGEVGQCWICPAHHHGRCSPASYLEYRPGFREFLAMASDPRGAVLTDAANYMVCPDIRKRPWPLPPCRVNEWCALIDLKRARPLTVPFGPARPFGAHVFEGVIRGLREGEKWQEFSNNLGVVLDTGIAWFRDVHRLGHSCAHVPLDGRITHWGGHTSMFDHAVYQANEDRARAILERDYHLRWGAKA